MAISPANSSIKLLLVDDEEGFAQVIAKRLTKRNIRTTVALSGSQAIEILRKNQFDVAVVDLKMRDIDGLQVLKTFKKIRAEMAVIILTGHGSELAAQKGIEAGAFDYLAKPCGLAELIEKIVQATGNKDLSNG
jgi:ActR/RegA family two-component response regulator